MLSTQAAFFYSFRSKTVRSWDGNRTVLVRKPYGFGTENVKGKRLETDSKPFNHTLVHTLPNKLIRELQNSYTARFISAIRLINFHSKIR